MRVLVVLLLFSSPSFAGEKSQRAVEAVKTMLDDEETRRELAELVITAAAMKLCDGEKAAFVVRRADGKLVVIPWNIDCLTMKKTYRGIVPPNAVAIAHTHPDGRPSPSVADFNEARRIGIPICVLTRKGVSMAHPSERVEVVLLADASWTLR